MATDDLGNQRVDFAWGNMPMQPNNDRDDVFMGFNKIIPPALGAKGIHDINGTLWNNYPENNEGEEGRVLPIEDGGFLWPSYGVCYTNPKTKDGRWEDFIEYLRSCGVNPNRLKEATFVGGDDKYDYNGGEYDGGVIFWDYIPADTILAIDWETGWVLTGKDMDGMVISSSHSWGTEVAVDPESDLDLSFVAFTNDPNKDTANWWY